MTTQIALKLSLPESAQAQFLRHPLLRSSVRRQREALVSIYYDTPGFNLHEHGVTLRLRKNGTGWQQTVKSHADSKAGLTTRTEWESPYLDRFDFSLISDAPVRKLLEKSGIVKNLAAMFETNFRRVIWHLEPAPGVTVLVMLDRGWIAASGRRSVISEIELELVEGSPADLYQIARDLSARILLVPEMVSKAERGYRLVQNQPAAPTRAAGIAIDATAHPLAVFRGIALDCLSHVHHNHAGALAAIDPEYVHQMRVGTRRLRAAMRMFAPVLPEDFVTQLVPSLRELMSSLGRTRDYDVLHADIVSPVTNTLRSDPRIAALLGIITDQLYAARAETVAYLAAPGYGRLLLLAAALLHDERFSPPPPLPPPQPSAAEAATATATATAPTLLDFAQQRLRKLRQRTVTLANAARADDPPSLHALRIAIKRLRYALEFFKLLLPANAIAGTLKDLSTLQDELGQLNDLANAGAVLMACAGNDPNLREAVALIGGWHGPRHAALLGNIPRHLERVRELRLPRLKHSRKP